ncbi:MAG: ATP-binding protein, partial [Acidimicrobiales bacterium]
HAVTTLAPEASSGRDARRFVQGALEDWGWPGPAAFQDLQDILLLTSELAINAAHHAHSTMEVTVHYWPGAKVKVEVHDEGEGMPRVHQPATFEESGRGLALVDLLSESWGVHSAALGKTVWFQLQLR